MNVRRALETDLEGIGSVLEQLMRAKSARRRAIWPHLLRDRSYAAWVAESDGEVGGFLDLFIWHDIGHGEKVGLVNNLVVDGRIRGRGIGQNLLREAIQYCTNQGAVELHVWTDADNKEALGLYRKLGFTERGLLLEIKI